MKYNPVVTFTGICLMSFCLAGCHAAGTHAPVVPDSLKENCIRVLRKVMINEPGFVKVHAAEYLLWSGHPEHVKEVFMQQEQQFDTVAPYRIGIWRVLARADSSSKEKETRIGKILQVFKDTAATDRANAAETLAKLNVSPATSYPEITRNAIESGLTSLSLYTLWAASLSGGDRVKACRDKLLNIIISSGKKDTLQRTLAAYILRHIGGLNAREWEALSARALSEPVNGEAGVYLLSAAFVTAPQDSLRSKTYSRVKKELLSEKDSPKAGARTEMAAALSEKGTKEALPVLLSLLHNKNPLGVAEDDADVESAAAYAILEIGRRYE